MSSEWQRWETVTKYVSTGHKLYRASAPNYDSSDSSQRLTPSAVQFLTEKGIDSIISFNQYPYKDNEKELLVGAKITYHHLPVEDFKAPTLGQLQSAIGFFNDIKQHSTLVHCGYGYGRTGTGVTALQLAAMKGTKPTEDEWEENHVETDDQREVLRQLRDKIKA